MTNITTNTKGQKTVTTVKTPSLPSVSRVEMALAAVKILNQKPEKAPKAEKPGKVLSERNFWLTSLVEQAETEQVAAVKILDENKEIKAEISDLNRGLKRLEDLGNAEKILTDTRKKHEEVAKKVDTLRAALESAKNGKAN